MANGSMDRAQRFADEMEAILEDNLVSIIAFGSQVRPGYGPAHGDLRLLLVVRDATTDALRPIEPGIANWVKRREPPPLIFSLAEWRASTDVFPMEIEDMREAHRSLKGEDPFDDLHTTPVDLRHELEREIRGKLLQLRSEYAAVASDGKALTRLLLDSVGTFFVIMRGMMRLVGGTPEAEPRDLVVQASEAAGLDPSAFDWVVTKMTGATVRALRSYDPIGARYVDEIEKMAAFVDAFDHNRIPRSD